MKQFCEIFRSFLGLKGIRYCIPVVLFLSCLILQLYSTPTIAPCVAVGSDIDSDTYWFSAARVADVRPTDNRYVPNSLWLERQRPSVLYSSWGVAVPLNGTSDKNLSNTTRMLTTLYYYMGIDWSFSDVGSLKPVIHILIDLIFLVLFFHEIPRNLWSFS